MDTANTNNLQTYNWNAPSFITHVDIRDHARGGSVAYLYAPEDADGAKLHELRDEFRRKGWATSPDLRDDQSVLRVTGIDNKEEFFGLLRDKEFTHGQSNADVVARDKPKPFADRIKQHSLRASGIAYTIGNSLYVFNGLARGKDWSQMKTGIAFASGDVAVAIVGGKDDQRQFKTLMTRLARNLKKNGIPIPQDSALAAEISTKGESLGERTYDFAHRHIDKIKAAAEVAGGYYYFKTGRNQKNIWKQICSVIFGLGFGTSALIPEKKTDPDELAHAGPIKKAWAYWQESPLRVAGWSGYSNTILTTVGAVQERKAQLKLPAADRLNAYRWDFATAGTMAVANGLYASSHKSGGGELSSGALIDDVYGLTAQVLYRLPPEKREKAIKVAAQFLGDRIELKDTHAKVEAHLRQHMTHAEQKNPWFIGAAHTPEPDPSIPARAPTRTKDGNWAEFVSRPGSPEAVQSI